MEFFGKKFGSKKKSEVLTDEEIIAAGACPNCWGNQSYDDQYLDFVKDSTKSNINHDKENKKAFIQQFIETNLTGIRLKKDGDRQTCPVCKTKYKHLTGHAN